MAKTKKTKDKKKEETKDQPRIVRSTSVDMNNITIDQQSDLVFGDTDLSKFGIVAANEKEGK